MTGARIIPLDSALKLIKEMTEAPGAVPSRINTAAVADTKNVLMVHIPTTKEATFKTAMRSDFGDSTVNTKPMKMSEALIYSAPHDKGGTIALMRHSPELVELMQQHELLNYDAEHMLTTTRVTGARAEARKADTAGGVAGSGGGIGGR